MEIDVDDKKGWNSCISDGGDDNATLVTISVFYKYVHYLFPVAYCLHSNFGLFVKTLLMSV